MIRKTIFASAIALAAAAPAFAQTTTAPPASAPATTMEKAGAAAAGAVQATKDAAAGMAHATARIVNGWVDDLDALRPGWTLKRSVIGQSVYNEANERIGEIDEVIVVPESNMAYAVVGVGGFLGIGETNVVTPLSSIRRVNDKFVMPGVSKDSVKAAKPYVYTR